MNDVRQLECVDTNVLIYAHDLSAGQKHIQARALIQKLWEYRGGCLSIQVLQEFYVNVTHKVAKSLTSEAASQVITEIAVWQVHHPGVNEVLDATSIQDRYQISFWDAMIIARDLHLGCETPWSDNLKPGQAYEQVVVANPFKYIAFGILVM
ncbi:MAG: PIN domain-containing protein [Candidatus Promineifilaceae bacterium]